jgi:hypothetical protein
MKFAYNNKEYRINFSQVTDEILVPGIGRVNQRSTIARIRTGERGKDELLIAKGKVTCYYKDIFSYEEGRKRALELALESSDYWNIKVFRTAAWTAYHSRQGGLLDRKRKAATAKANAA